MPLHDVKCRKCGHTPEELYLPGNRPSTFICNNCDHVQDFKPLPGKPAFINMGNRPIEKKLEQS